MSSWWISTKLQPIKLLSWWESDVGKEADIKAAVDLAVKEFGRLDVMVSYLVSFFNVYSLPSVQQRRLDWIILCPYNISRYCRDHAPRRRPCSQY
jgi:hypothetical protein